MGACRWDADLLFAIECLKDTPTATLQTLGASLDSWKEEIVRMCGRARPDKPEDAGK